MEIHLMAGSDPIRSDPKTLIVPFIAVLKDDGCVICTLRAVGDKLILAYPYGREQEIPIDVGK